MTSSGVARSRTTPSHLQRANTGCSRRRAAGVSVLACIVNERPTLSLVAILRPTACRFSANVIVQPAAALTCCLVLLPQRTAGGCGLLRGVLAALRAPHRHLSRGQLELRGVCSGHRCVEGLKLVGGGEGGAGEGGAGGCGGGRLGDLGSGRKGAWGGGAAGVRWQWQAVGGKGADRLRIVIRPMLARAVVLTGWGTNVRTDTVRCAPGLLLLAQIAKAATRRCSPGCGWTHTL